MEQQHLHSAMPAGMAEPAIKPREKKKGSINAFCLGFWAIAERVQLYPTTAG